MVGPPHPLTKEALVESIVEAIPEIIALLLVPITHLGSVLIIVPALAIAYLKRPQLVAPWFGAVAAYYGIMSGIKSLNGATRPDVVAPIEAEAYPAFFSFWHAHATEISTTSFPSGNAMLAVLLAGLITLDLNVGTRRQRALSTGSVAALVVFSRVGLGVHYPVDVVGGAIFGLGVLGIVVLLRRHTRDPTAATLTFGIVCTAVAMWLTTPAGQPPTVEAIAGSNTPLAFAGALGMLIGWHLKEYYRHRRDPRSAPVLAAALFGSLVLIYGGFSLPDSPLLMMGQAVIFCAAFGLLPWLITRNSELTQQASASRRAD